MWLSSYPNHKNAITKLVWLASFLEGQPLNHLIKSRVFSPSWTKTAEFSQSSLTKLFFCGNPSRFSSLFLKIANQIAQWKKPGCSPTYHCSHPCDPLRNDLQKVGKKTSSQAPCLLASYCRGFFTFSNVIAICWAFESFTQHESPFWKLANFTYKPRKDC